MLSALQITLTFHKNVFFFFQIKKNSEGSDQNVSHTLAGTMGNLDMLFAAMIAIPLVSPISSQLSLRMLRPIYNHVFPCPVGYLESLLLTA